MTSSKFVLKKDIIIPAGTELSLGPRRTTYYTPHLEVDIGFTKDITGNFRIDLEEAQELGLVDDGTG